MNSASEKVSEIRIEGDPTDWMNNHIMLNVPGWLDHKRDLFKFNKLYDFWRANYIGKLREAIKDFALLMEFLPLPARYSLAISGMQIYIRQDGSMNESPCFYERLSGAVPMNSPVEPEAIWEMVTNHSKISFIGCSFGHIAKSHVLRGKNLEGMLSLRDLFDSELGSEGYETAMLLCVGHRDTEYMVSITHSTESFPDFVEAAALDGFKLFGPEDGANVEPDPLSLDDELALEEASLLEQLEIVRAQRRALNEVDPHLGEM